MGRKWRGRPVSRRDAPGWLVSTLGYQLLEPWHAFAQVPAVAFHPALDATSFTPFMWVAAFVVVVLYPLPWQVPHVAREEWVECLPVAGGMEWHVPQDAGGGVQACDRTGVPAQPDGEEDTTVRV
jgi:hypothetical protein